MCHNSSGILQRIVLDPQEPQLPQCGDIILRRPPLYVEVYMEAADKKGVKLKGFDRGVVPIGVKCRTFEVKVGRLHGMVAKIYHIKRYQLPLVSGTISSCHRAQGETLADCLLDMRQPETTHGVGTEEKDNTLLYVAISRATSLESLRLLFPITLEQMQTKPAKDPTCLMAWITEQSHLHKSKIHRGTYCGNKHRLWWCE